jgi:protein ImuB
LGQAGLDWQAMARGQDVRPLVPTLPEERFESSIELEWPIEGLEPLSFVLTRLLEPLSTRLERRDRGAAALHVTLGLVRNYEAGGAAGEAGRAGRAGREESLSSYTPHLPHPPYPSHLTSLQLPAPMRDVRALRTLILLDLESHPPPAAIERVSVLIDPTPGRVLQHALFTRAQPAPEQLSTLIARLSALMGQDRLGCPALVDSYRPGAFEMRPFATEWNHQLRTTDRRSTANDQRRVTHDQRPTAHDQRPTTNERPTTNDQRPTTDDQRPLTALRRCRRPVPARVSIADGKPVHVTTDRRGYAGGPVLACTGPWRTSGEWWIGIHEAGRAGESPRSQSWDRDEWDVSLGDGMVCRIFRDRSTDSWFIDAVVD